jgi:hypothetical protein
MKILIVRYIRNSDNYFFDLFDAASAGALRDAGHEAAVVERVLAEGFDEEEVLEGIYQFAAEFAPDLVFLSYVPTRAMPQTLAARTGAIIAATGSSLLLEGTGIDYVLAEPDPLALVQLVEVLEGKRETTTVAALSWQEDGVSRRTGIPLHTVFEIFTRCRIDYEAFYRLGPGTPFEVRKHVAGDWGCPYRHVAPPAPIPGERPAWVPAGGCTFCTRPDWAKLDWDLKGPVISQQMDRVLAAFPNPAKLVVIDEYGLANVDDLATLARGKPLEGSELLISGRLDHLERHRHRLEEALKTLRESNTLRLYQFGIENLSDDVLLRYNKGIVFGDIEAALHLIDELDEKHANLAVERSFGFILFDPWTSLEELRTNVRRALRLGLDRYRGQAPFTSLRLLPEMALYWRARAEGLLTGDVRDNVFGYSVDSGWHFRHQAVAEVYAEALRRRGQSPPWQLLGEVLDEA